MTELDFSGLTADQRRLMDAGGWAADGTQAAPSRPATQTLVSRGLLESYTATQEDDHGSYRVTEYFVPLEVRAAWLAFKSRLAQQVVMVEEEP
jgi:hypothetical protein